MHFVFVRTSRLLLSFFVCIGFLVFKANASEQHKIALVIGNSEYYQSPLKNPVNDAKAVADSLKGVGFEVILASNASHDGMDEALEKFRQKIRPNSVAFFYYAGHGVQVKDKNYLMPIGAMKAIKTEKQVKRHSVNVDSVLEIMEDGNNYLNVVILDACRNNPLPAASRGTTRGLKRPSLTPPNTIIMYSTSEDSVALDGEGKNSPFTRYLLQNMNNPALEIDRVFKKTSEQVAKLTNNEQIPARYSKGGGDFWLHGRPDGAVSQVAVADQQWLNISESQNVNDFKEFFQNFPNSRWADNAKDIINELEAAEASKMKPDPQSGDATFAFRKLPSGKLSFAGIEYVIEDPFLIPLSKGNNQFTLTLDSRHKIYGNIELLFVPAMGVAYGFDKALPKPSHLQRVLTGAPVRYTVSTTTEEGNRVQGMRYTLSLMPIRVK